jgi:hypothetical protein
MQGRGSSMSKERTCAPRRASLLAMRELMVEPGSVTASAL